MTSSYNDILNSLEDENYYAIDINDLSPSLQSWSNFTDVEEIDLDSLKISFNSDSWVDPLESAITATRNGSKSVLSTLSQFATILSQTGIPGPHLLQATNLSKTATKIGNGSQFTVFKHPNFQGQVVKRINVPLSSRAEQRFAESVGYRSQLKTLELEVLSLCNPILRGHSNITSLLAWGFDYPFADLAVPLLFVEAALMSLTDFLITEERDVEVKYQLALGIANGLEVLHNLKIVHGDVKPENILIFASQIKSVPFQAKLSDFGVCLDLEKPEESFTLGDYRGTPAWIAPEVVRGGIDRFGGFSPDLMFRFDAYSFGLVLLSTFTSNGRPPTNRCSESIIEMFNRQKNMPSDVRIQLRKATLSLLTENPTKRPLPSPTLLKADTPAYKSWLASIQSKPTNNNAGLIDPIYNKGPLFWYRFDASIRSELEEQYAQGENSASFDGDVLFGIAQTITGQKPSYLDRMLRYLTDAAKSGYTPARAVYAQVMEAHGRAPEIDQETLEQWMLQSVSEGYLFAKPGRLEKKMEECMDNFRRDGGFCSDPFVTKINVKTAIKTGKVLEWTKNNGLIVDRKGNTTLHAAAAFGAVDAVHDLLNAIEIDVNTENDNGETPLYKAFQAGHTKTIMLLLDHGATSFHKTRQKMTPLHWLFMIPEYSTRQIAQRMVDIGAELNAVMEPAVIENSGGFPVKMQMLHYPFELPHGTPLHWACFFRNMVAIKALISLGANVDAIYYGSDASSTPLSLAAYFGELEISKYLISHGADGTLLDSIGRNTLHSITKYFPERHGYLPHCWHYWIRHGTWDNHLVQMENLVKVLIDAGADINAKDKNDYSTPILAAADLGVWDGGLICALLAAGADLKESSLSRAGDTVLHLWVSIVGPRLDYPESYLSTLSKIVETMPNLDIARRFLEDRPFHLLATTYHPEEEFEAACRILFCHDFPADLNAKNRRGFTPLSIALGTDLNPARRGRFLLEKGADPFVLNDQGLDILFFIANNAVLKDRESYDLIQYFLLYLGTDMKKVYETNFLPNPNSTNTLSAAAGRGKPLTVALLLTLGLVSRINDPDRTKSPPWTPLDHALHYAELSRRAHIRGLASYRYGVSRTKALENNLVYDDHQGPPARAAEAYKSYPEVIEILCNAGAKRTCDLERNINGDYIEQPGAWDRNEIQGYGFTRESQPNVEDWKDLYRLANYSLLSLDGWSWLIGGK
ncbi:hypothetical protein N7495_001021 [Penicillium taxi]|uniref:uncharacterized protein n=1 Tax=Penicillium taxi TaxID=168475 RepID=UPI00254567B0|nr:uncharacterized protein N7495_001021 [Penicillium taxi]KAJ5908339.1 hypothetical protein N7495_001021 [Penicillium taxi]